MKADDLSLNPELGYDAFIHQTAVSDITKRTGAVIDDEAARSISFGGVVGFVDLYPSNVGFTDDGEFDVDLWEASRHPLTLFFTPNRAGYRKAVVSLRHQVAPVDIIDTADGYGFIDFESKLRKLR